LDFHLQGNAFPSRLFMERYPFQRGCTVTPRTPSYFTPRAASLWQSANRSATVRTAGRRTSTSDSPKTGCFATVRNMALSCCARAARPSRNIRRFGLGIPPQRQSSQRILPPHHRGMPDSKSESVPPLHCAPVPPTSRDTPLRYSTVQFWRQAGRCATVMLHSRAMIHAGCVRFA
jgi:hypothetical protein